MVQPLTSVKSLISQAIREQRLLSLTYHGLGRVVEPHALGKAPAGHELLRAFQVRGGHRSPKWHRWVLLKVEQLEEVELLEETFDEPREGYQPGDSAMAEVHTEL